MHLSIENNLLSGLQSLSKNYTNKLILPVKKNKNWISTALLFQGHAGIVLSWLPTCQMAHLTFGSNKFERNYHWCFWPVKHWFLTSSNYTHNTVFSLYHTGRILDMYSAKDDKNALTQDSLVVIFCTEGPSFHLQPA